jgi:hypothetical protein
MPVSGNVRNPCEAARLAAAVLADVTVEKAIGLHVNDRFARAERTVRDVT